MNLSGASYPRKSREVKSITLVVTHLSESPPRELAPAIVLQATLGPPVAAAS
jgi:hypothetical protein